MNIIVQIPFLQFLNTMNHISNMKPEEDAILMYCYNSMTKQIVSRKVTDKKKLDYNVIINPKETFALKEIRSKVSRYFGVAR